MTKLINKRFLLSAVIVCLSVCLILFFLGIGWIGYEVRYQCQKSQSKFDGDCVETLSQVLQDDSQSFSDRNSAVWALGQLGDARALPTLQKYYTGDIPEREPLNETLSQYELKKAINLTSGGQNIIAIFWRWLIPSH